MLQTQTAATRFTVRSRAHASASASSRAAAAPLRRRSVTVAAAGGPRFGSSGGDGGGNGEKLAWVCGSCGYVYNDASKPFESLPSSWKCPVCKAPKAAFEERVPPPNIFLPIAAAVIVLAGIFYLVSSKL